MRKIRKDTLPDVTKLTIAITNGRDRFKLKRKYCFQWDATDDLRNDATTFIGAVLAGDIDSLKQDASVSHRALNRKVYLSDKEY